MSLGREALVASAFRRDLLVRSAAQRWIMNPASAGMTGMPLHLRGTPCRVGCSAATSGGPLAHYPLDRLPEET